MNLFLEPYAEYGALLRNQRHNSTPKTARYQARHVRTNYPDMLCRVFAARKGGKPRLFIWVSRVSSNRTAVFLFCLRPGLLKEKYEKRLYAY